MANRYGGLQIVNYCPDASVSILRARNLKLKIRKMFFSSFFYLLAAYHNSRQIWLNHVSITRAVPEAPEAQSQEQNLIHLRAN